MSHRHSSHHLNSSSAPARDNTHTHYSNSSRSTKDVVVPPANSFTIPDQPIDNADELHSYDTHEVQFC